MNFWTRFKALLPGDRLDIGTVTAIDPASGISALELPGGGVLTARGTDVPVGSKAFVRAGVIEGPAPDLEYFEIEV